MAIFALCPMCEKPIRSSNENAKTFTCCGSRWRFDSNPVSESVYDVFFKKQNAKEMRERAKKGLKKATKKVIKDVRKNNKGDGDGLADKVEEFAVEGDQTSPEQGTDRVAERGREMTEKTKDEDFEHTCGAKVTVGQARCQVCGKELDWSEYGE